MQRKCRFHKFQMEGITMGQSNGNQGKGPKYILNIEGNEIPWDEDTITTEQIAELGG